MLKASKKQASSPDLAFEYWKSWPLRILDSTSWALDSSLCQWNLDSGFQSLVKFRIPKPRIPDSTSRNFRISLHGVGGAQRACSQVTLNCVVVVVCLLVFFWISSWSREDHAHGLSVYSWLAFPSTISIFLIGCMLSQFSRQLRISSPRFSRSTRKHTPRTDPLWRLKQLQSCPWYYCRFWRLLWPRLLLNTAL